jgi:hypothetical protein
MKKIFLFIIFLLAIYTSYSQVYVEGYYRKNGTYVQPHYRSSPDNSPYNNYSYPGNINPYTGKEATGNPETYLKRYKNRGNVSESGLSNSGVPNDYYYNRRNSNYYDKKHYRVKGKNGIGLFLISVPVVFGTLLLLTLKK